jgi:hypothetical protein
MTRSTLALVLIGALTLGCRGKPTAARACQHAAALCGVDDDGDCAEGLRELESTLGESYQPLLTCAVEARSCPEVAGCLVGGAERVGDRIERQFGLGRDRMRPHPDGTSTRPRGAGRGDDVLASCDDFTAGNNHAQWDGCADHVRREVVCAPFIDDLKCDCLEDGAKTWFFHARNPPLANRADATRVARANCEMGFGN